MMAEIVEKNALLDYVWVPNAPISILSAGGDSNAPHHSKFDYLVNGSFAGDIVYSAAPAGSPINEIPLRKYSFRTPKDSSKSFERHSRASSSDYGWYELDDVETVNEIDGDLEDMPPAQMHSVEIIARWHEVNGAVNQIVQPLLLRRVLIRDFLISTRHFSPAKEPTVMSTTITSRGSATALAAMHSERATSITDTVSFAWAIPEIRIMKGSSKDYAEYLVVGCLGDTVLTSWRRYSDFMAWALQAKELKFTRAVQAWEDVIEGKRIFRCLDPGYLRHKSFSLESFLQQLLFEVPSYTKLLSFFDHERIQEQDLKEETVSIQPMVKLLSNSSLSNTVLCTE